MQVEYHNFTQYLCIFIVRCVFACILQPQRRTQNHKKWNNMQETQTKIERYRVEDSARSMIRAESDRLHAIKLSEQQRYLADAQKCHDLARAERAKLQAERDIIERAKCEISCGWETLATFAERYAFSGEFAKIIPYINAFLKNREADNNANF